MKSFNTAPASPSYRPAAAKQNDIPKIKPSLILAAVTITAAICFFAFEAFVQDYSFADTAASGTDTAAADTTGTGTPAGTDAAGTGTDAAGTDPTSGTDPASGAIEPAPVTYGDNEVAPVWIGNPESNTAEIIFLTNKKGTRYEFRELSKQKMYGYDTFQGGCTDKKYSYYVMYNRAKLKCKIIKVRIKTQKVVKVSNAWKLHHGNDITYNTRTKQLVVCHGDGALKRLTLINAKDLSFVKHINVNIPNAVLPGAKKSYVAAIKGFTGIGYDIANDQYVVSLKGCRHYMTLNNKFVPTRVIKVPKVGKYLPQGLDVKNGYILRSMSFSSSPYNHNIVYIFDLMGNFIKTLKLGTGYEIESIYFVNNRMYGATYRSYYKTITKKVKKKVLVAVKKKNGKVKYKYKTKKVKQSYYVLRRDNNIIRIKNY